MNADAPCARIMAPGATILPLGRSYSRGESDTILTSIGTIMAQWLEFDSLLKDRRAAAGWSQDELARRSGLSRAGVSAIENGRLVPSAAAALALAAAFGCRVEDLFALARPAADAGAGDDPWAWPPGEVGSGCRFWRAEVGGRVRYYPVEPTALGVV